METAIQQIYKNFQKQKRPILYSNFDGFLEISNDGKIIDANDAYCKIVGKTREEILSKYIYDLTYYSKKHDVLKNIENIRMKGFDVFETQHKHSSGSKVDFEVYALSPNTENGNLLVFYRNISNRKKNEYEALLNQKRIQSLHDLIMISPKNDEQTLIHFALEESVKITNSKFGYFHFLNSEQQTIQLYTWYVEPLKICAPIQDFHYALDSAGILADCIRLKKPVIFNNSENFAVKKNLPEEQLQLIRYISVPIFDDDGKNIIVVGNGNKTDLYNEDDVKQLEIIMQSLWRIIKRKRVEDSLVKFQQAVEQSPTSIVLTNTKGTIEYVNPKFCEVTGYTFEEAIGKNPRILKSGEMNSDGYKHLWDTVLKGKEWRGELHNKKKNGQLFWESASISPIKNSDGEIINILAVKEDITEKKSIELQLYKNEEFIRSIIGSIDDLVFVLNKDGIFLEFFQPQKENDLIIPKENFIGKHYNDVNFPKYLESLLHDHIHIAEETFQTQQFDYYLKSPSGDLWYSAKLSVRRNSQSEFDGVTIICRDITERIEQESRRELLGEELRLKNKELEKKINEIQNIHQSLIQSEKMASIGQLTAGIAHEINNPLAFVSSNINRFNEYFEDVQQLLTQWKNYAEIQLQTPECELKRKEILALEKEIDLPFITEDFIRLLKNTKEGTERIKKIVDQLRGFTHMADSQFSEANIIDAIEDTIVLTWNELKYKATIEKQYQSIPCIQCNVGEIKQVLVNILVNAAHAIVQTGKITISTEVLKDFVAIKISDTGSGIEKEIVKKIFDPFFTTKPVGKGTGLGLWITSTIIQKHKGTISVESTLGVGTTFSITLPIKHEK